jgi:putative transposase
MHLGQRGPIGWEGPLPRHARLDVPGTLYHVMVRGSEEKNIFQDEENRRAFIERIRSLARETEARVLAWALMDNHVYLLLISDPAGLPTLMRRLLAGCSVNNRRTSDEAIFFRTALKT